MATAGGKRALNDSGDERPPAPDLPRNFLFFFP